MSVAVVVAVIPSRDLPKAAARIPKTLSVMKLVIAFIQPPKLSAVIAALNGIGVERLTVCDAQGFGQQAGHAGGRPGHVPPKLLRKTALEIVVNEDFLPRTLAAIEEAARSGAGGSIGDGKVLVVPVEEVIQLGGSDRGPGAV